MHYLLDRITYRVRILEVNEEGYRLRQSRQDAVLTSPRLLLTPVAGCPLRLIIAVRVIHLCSAACLGFRLFWTFCDRLDWREPGHITCGRTAKLYGQ